MSWDCEATITHAIIIIITITQHIIMSNDDDCFQALSNSLLFQIITNSEVTNVDHMDSESLNQR